MKAEVLAAAEQQPARLLEDGVATLPFHAAGFLSADLVERLIHICDDVESVEDMQGSYPGAGKWQREQTAAEPLRGRRTTSMLFWSVLKRACS
jgi:hypothetical protein